MYTYKLHKFSSPFTQLISVCVFVLKWHVFCVTSLRQPFSLVSLHSLCFMPIVVFMTDYPHLSPFSPSSLHSRSLKDYFYIQQFAFKRHYALSLSPPPPPPPPSLSYSFSARYTFLFVLCTFFFCQYST